MGLTRAAAERRVSPEQSLCTYRGGGSCGASPRKIRWMLSLMAMRLVSPPLVNMITVMRSRKRRSMNARKPAVLPWCHTLVPLASVTMFQPKP
jgi:hypothetical protein